MAGVITASEPSWIAPFTGLSSRQFGKLVTVLRREGADAVRRGRPWSLPLEDRALLVAAYWRTNLTMRQLAPLFGVSKSAAGGRDELGGCREEAEPEATGPPPADFAGQGEHGHPREQVDGELDDLQPDLVLRGVVQG